MGGRGSGGIRHGKVSREDRMKFLLSYLRAHGPCIIADIIPPWKEFSGCKRDTTTVVPTPLYYDMEALFDEGLITRERVKRVGPRTYLYSVIP